MLRGGVHRFFTASLFPLAFSLASVLACVIGPATVQAQDLPPDLASRLPKERLIQEFQTRPKTLKLLPDFPGADEFLARHEGLKPHLVQEGLLLMPPDLAYVGMDVVLAVMRDARTLSGLAFLPEPAVNQQGPAVKPIPLFGEVSFVSPPVDQSAGGEPSFTYRLMVDDRDFGRGRFDVSVTASGKVALFRMVNLDSLHYWIMPAVPPGQALIDLVYFADTERGGMLYAAWSVRAVLYVPGVVDVRTPIERRAFALRDWFLRRVALGLEAAGSR